MTVPPTDPETPQKPERSRTWWPLILPVVLGLGVVIQQSQQTPPSVVITSNIAAMPTPKTPTATPRPQIQYSIPSTILVAGEDMKLHAKPFKNTLPENGGANLKVIETRWMNAVVEAAPELFPPGARVKSVRVSSDAEPAQVDFNAAFNAPNFWSGETKTKMAIYSIVNTLAPRHSPKGRDVPVLITVEGKRLQTVGEFDLSDAIAPDYSLNASPNGAQKQQSAVKEP